MNYTDESTKKLQGLLDYTNMALESLIKGMPEELLTREKRLMVSNIELAIKQMQLIAENQASIQMLNKGTLQPEYLKFSLKEDVEPELKVFMDNAALSGRRFNIDYAFRGNCIVTSDRQLYLRILTNFVFYAYTLKPEGAPITVSFINRNPALIETHITAAGKHEKRDLSGRLWMMFCQQAVELLGGRIWIESDPDAPSHMFGFTIRNGTISNKDRY